MDPAGILGLRSLLLVIIKGEDGNGDTDDHLRDLRHGNPHGIEPLGLQLHGHEEVISVHDEVNGVVHTYKPKTGGTGRGIRVPAVQQNGNVMVPMQKDQWLLVNNDKKGIDQFGEFTQTEHLDPETGRAGTELTFGIVADVIPQGHVVEVVGQLRCRADHTDEGEQTQTEVPHGESAAPRQWLAAVKVGPTAHDEDGIQHARNDRDDGIVLRPISYRHGVVVDLPSGS